MSFSLVMIPAQEVALAEGMEIVRCSVVLFKKRDSVSCKQSSGNSTHHANAQRAPGMLNSRMYGYASNGFIPSFIVGLESLPIAIWFVRKKQSSCIRDCTDISSWTARCNQTQGKEQKTKLLRRSFRIAEGSEKSQWNDPDSVDKNRCQSIRIPVMRLLDVPL